MDAASLKRELWLCHSYMKLNMADLYNLPTSDRRDYIKLHNIGTEKEKSRMGGKR